MIYGDMSFKSLMILAQEIRDGIMSANSAVSDDLFSQQALYLVEEVGEFVGALNRWRGLARRSGSFEDVAAELADVVISAFITAVVLGVDLPEWIQRKGAVITSRGYKEVSDVSK